MKDRVDIVSSDKYHPYDKRSKYLREALYNEYNRKCFYCDHLIEYRHMHIDHILPTNRPELIDDSVKKWVNKRKIIFFEMIGLELDCSDAQE